jgi:hypothetical protein
MRSMGTNTPAPKKAPPSPHVDATFATRAWRQVHSPDWQADQPHEMWLQERETLKAKAKDEPITPPRARRTRVLTPGEVRALDRKQSAQGGAQSAQGGAFTLSPTSPGTAPTYGADDVMDGGAGGAALYVERSVRNLGAERVTLPFSAHQSEVARGARPLAVTVPSSPSSPSAHRSPRAQERFVSSGAARPLWDARALMKPGTLATEDLVEMMLAGADLAVLEREDHLFETTSETGVDEMPLD